MKQFGLCLIKHEILKHLPNLESNPDIQFLDKGKINVTALTLLIEPIKSINSLDYEVLVSRIETYRMAC